MSTVSDPPPRIRREAADPHTAPERLREFARDPLLAPIVAANPAANAQLSRALAESDDAETRAAVTSHPNAPLESLLQLGRHRLLR